MLIRVNAWQTAAAIYSAYARDRDQHWKGEGKISSEELVNRAINQRDEHAIKFTEVMVAEHALNPDPAYLGAAEEACKRLAR